MIYITGSNGQLGKELIRFAHDNGVIIQALTRQDFDLTNREAVFNYFKNCSKGVIIHTAAYTKVDDAEENSEECFLNNVVATQNLVDVCKDQNLELLFISTDYVFDGTSELPYEVTSKTNPINVYGQSKEMAEKYILENLEKAFIVRISWVFGVFGSNFIKTILRISNERDRIQVVSDQYGSPTYTKDLAPRLFDLIQSKKYGIYHVTNEGYCSWYDLAKYIISKTNRNCEVSPLSTKDYTFKAKRPLNSKLSKKSLDGAGISRLAPWQNAVDRFLEELGEEL